MNQRSTVGCAVFGSVLMLLLSGCGDLLVGTESGNPNPHAGTESGNPINPTRPPAWDDVPMDSAETLDPGATASPVEPAVEPSSSTVDDSMEDLGELPGLTVEQPEMNSNPTPADVGIDLEPAAGVEMDPSANGQDVEGQAPGAGITAADGAGVGGNTETDAGTSACEPASCEALAQQTIATLAQPRTPVPADTTQTPECLADGGCQCAVAGGAIGLELSPTAACHVEDRLGQCAYGAQDFAACDLEQEGACDQPCAAAFVAWQEANAPLTASLQGAACAENGCRFVLFVEETQECVLGGDGIGLGAMECNDAGQVLTSP
jgi:hypothetical protein